jgi:hypothetical protein
MSKSLQAEVFAAIARERAYQDRKWGSLDTYDHSLLRWIEIAEEEIEEAKRVRDTSLGYDSASRELLQAAAVLVAFLEQHGVVEREQSA